MELKNANPGKRFLSFLLDSLISFPFYYVFVLIGANLEYDELVVKGIYNGLFLLFLVFCWVVFKGQTPGQMIMKLKIVNFETGKDIKISEAFLRLFGYLACNLTFLIGFIIMFFREDKRGLHDLISFTKVIDLNVVNKEINKDNTENLS